MICKERCAAIAAHFLHDLPPEGIDFCEVGALKRSVFLWIPIYALTALGLIVAGLLMGEAVSVISREAPPESRVSFVIDAGHGGVDGGAVSCRGYYEKHINLEISQRLDDLLHLLGYRTKMIRQEDISVYTQGSTIAEKKASDLKQRVRLVNETPQAILLSIHQNFYTDSRYYGAQVFYGSAQGSALLAQKLQEGFGMFLNDGSNRQCKQAQGIYLMKHIQRPGVLIECGFLSNYEEEALLRDPVYQKKLCCVIAGICAENWQQLLSGQIV